jgi:hypothetical protein
MLLFYIPNKNYYRKSCLEELLLHKISGSYINTLRTIPETTNICLACWLGQLQTHWFSASSYSDTEYTSDVKFSSLFNECNLKTYETIFQIKLSENKENSNTYNNDKEFISKECQCLTNMVVKRILINTSQSSDNKTLLLTHPYICYNLYQDTCITAHINLYGALY